MNQFIEECRREWKRLRVPEQVADEMAADLEADLDEAEAEGASRQDVLGGGAADPRSFAASWAEERGVIPPLSTARYTSRSLGLAAVAALTIVAAAGAVLVIFASPGASTSAPAVRLSAPPPLPMSVWFDRDGVARIARIELARRKADTAHQAVVLAQVARDAVWVQANDDVALSSPQTQGVEIHPVGSILLIVGIVGLILSMPFLIWSRRRPS